MRRVFRKALIVLVAALVPLSFLFAVYKQRPSSHHVRNDPPRLLREDVRQRQPVAPVPPEVISGNQGRRPIQPGRR